MMLIERDRDGYVVTLDHHALTSLANCKRRAIYSLVEHLHDRGSAATGLGLALHEADPVWRATGDKAKAVAKAREVMSGLPEKMWTDWQNPDRAGQIMSQYMEHYKEDPLQVFHLAGVPQVEQVHSIVLHTEPGLSIIWVAKIDWIGYTKEASNLLWVVDKKSTSYTGDARQGWLSALRNSNQFQGYNLTAGAVYELTGEYKLVGTKLDCIYTRPRIPTAGNLDHFFRDDILRDPYKEASLVRDVVDTVKEFLPVWEEWQRSRTARRDTSQCFNYQRPCPYLPICSVPWREALVEARYERRVWAPGMQGVE